MEATEFTTDQFDFDPKTGVMVAEASTLRLNGFPKVIKIRSTHTGRAVAFFVDIEAAQNNEFWDGELCEYIPALNCSWNRARKVVILND